MISPYLFDASLLSDPHIVVRETSKPLNGFPKLIIGSKPIDGGHYIFTEDERDSFLNEEPGAGKFMRPFIGSREFINGGTRYILRLAEASPDEIRLLPKVQERIVAVRDYRQTSRSLPTQKLADTPTLYHVNVVPDEAYLVIPEVSSERRTYIPIAWLEPPTIPSNKVRILGNATLTQFGLLSSRIHIAWARYIGGRLKSDFQYGIGVVYNTFPMPPVSGDALEKLEPLTQAVLDARAVHTDSSLADLYDPDLMPPNFRKAHQALDQAVDRLYRRSGFDSDRERVEHLLALYEKSVAPLMAGQKKKRRRRASKNAN